MLLKICNQKADTVRTKQVFNRSYVFYILSRERRIKKQAILQVNPYVTNGLSHPHHLDEPNLILGASGVFVFQR